MKKRTISLRAGMLGQNGNSDFLTLRSISGEETLSQTYKYVLNITTALDMPQDEAVNLDIQSMIGCELTVTIQLDGMGSPFSEGMSQVNMGAGIREISGVVTEARLAKQYDQYFLYQITIEPWIVFAKRRIDYRIFQEKSVVEIIDEVLGGQSVYMLWQKRLSKIYPVVTYEVQYGESDYDFIQRLMERSGIYWFFEHSENMHRMVLIDNIAAHEPPVSQAYHSLSYSPAKIRLDREFIQHFDITERLQSGTWTTSDFDFMQPGADLTVNHSQPKKASTQRLVVYEWPGNYSDPSLGAEYAQVRMEELHARSWHASGRGNLRNVVCGTTFEMTGHPKESANGHYLVTCSKLEAKEIGEASASGEYLFTSSFDVQPLKFAWRPARNTPQPRTSGPQTAIVTGPPAQEIWTDSYGRVRLKFHWDRSSVIDHNSSCWVRVSYPWAGNNFGGINVPRVGTEVIVDFENGDPNRPIVTGRVFNAATMPPWELPSSATQSGFMSRSLKGGLSNANALRFEDRMGQEEVWLQAERDMLTEVKNNEVHRVQVNLSQSIGGDETTDIQGTRTENVTGDEKIAILANRSRSVAQNDQIDIGGNQQTSIKGDQQYDVQKDRIGSVGGNSSLIVTGERQVQVDKSQQTAIQQDLLERINGNRSSQVGKTYHINVEDKIEIIVGSSSLTMEKNGSITLSGEDIIISGKSVQIDGETIDMN